jgi:RND family efflux transporter MFP subunit
MQKLVNGVLAAAWLIASPLYAAGVPGIKPLDCVIEPNATIKIGSAAEGILREVMVGRGAHVKRGDLLATLDQELERHNVELAKLRAEMDVEVKSGLATLDFRSRETKRIADLRVSSAIPEKEFDKAKVEERLARLSFKAARAEQKIAQVEYRRAQEQLHRRSILSPRDGVVVDVDMAPGEYVHEQAPLMTIAAIDPLHVEVYAPVVYFGRISKGMRAEVRPEAPIGGRHEAVVMVVDQVFDPASRTFGVRLELPNPDYSLPAGLRCKVEFSGGLTAAEADDTDLPRR